MAMTLRAMETKSLPQPSNADTSDGFFFKSASNSSTFACASFGKLLALYKFADVGAAATDRELDEATFSIESFISPSPRSAPELAPSMLNICLRPCDAAKPIALGLPLGPTAPFFGLL